jgi:hypothetical protein
MKDRQRNSIEVEGRWMILHQIKLKLLLTAQMYTFNFPRNELIFVKETFLVFFFNLFLTYIPCLVTPLPFPGSTISSILFSRSLKVAET